MAKTETLHTRLEPEVKTSVESTLRMLGLSASEAVNIFFHQILLHEGLPFAVQKPRFTPETLLHCRGLTTSLREKFPANKGLFPSHIEYIF